MKKRLLAAAAALFLAAGTLSSPAVILTQTVCAETSGEVYYVNVSDFLSVRAAATSSSSELYRLSDGTKVIVKGWSGNWAYAYVPSVDDSGYVYGGYLVRDAGTGGTVRYVNVSDFLALRTQATSSSAEIRRLSNGTKLLVQSSGSSWSYVYVPSTGEYGYVYNAYISETNPLNYDGAVYYADVSDFLALRRGPSTSYSEITRLDPWTEVRLLDTTGNWAYVYVPSKDATGYVYKGYLSTSYPDPDEQGTLYYVNVRTFLSVRSQPSSSSKELHRLSRGVRVRVLSTTGSWGYAYIPATEDYGYVYMGYLSRTRPV